MRQLYPGGRVGRIGAIIVGAVVLGLVTGGGYLALTSNSPDRQVALPDKGRMSDSPSPTASASLTGTPTASPSASAPLTASASPTTAPTVTGATTSPTSTGTTTGVPIPPSPDAPATASAPSRTVYTVNSRLFGVHDADPLGASWPKAPVRSLRVWDSGDMWRNIETRPGRFDFSHLDATVRTARAHGADVLVVLGQTPSFHAVNPGASSFYGAGASSMPRMAAWKRYVAKVAARYRGQPVAFQVWNEANVIGFWSGTPQQMAQLTKATYDVLQAVNPRATLVAPALVTRLSSQRTWLNKFYAQRAGGRPVANWVDVVSLQLYPAASGKPEDSMRLLATNRAILARHGVYKPIWNTEVNYGMTGRPVRPLSSSRQAGYVARTYLLNAANGVARVYWYGWQTQSTVNTRLVTSNLSSLTAAGVAFGTVSSWMKGARIDSCPIDAAGTYTCTLTKSGVTRRVYWNPTRSVSVVAERGATAYQKLDGTRGTLSGGARLRVNHAPVMVS